MATHAAALRSGVSLVEYLAFEDAVEEKHILWDGEIFPNWGMPGASLTHDTIAGNVLAAIRGAVQGRACGRC